MSKGARRAPKAPPKEIAPNKKPLKVGSAVKEPKYSCNVFGKTDERYTKQYPK